MKINKLLILSVLALALFGCGKREPRHIVILTDVSGSIDRESLEQAFKAIEELAGHLKRGDRLTLIPILGDAEAETSGNILHFEVPANRQAYDTDLRTFRSKLNASLKEMQTNAMAHPGAKTDILGAVLLAEQEFNLYDNHSMKVLAILSDFIQEDRQFDFRTDHNLSSAAFVQKFAQRQAQSRSIRLDKTKAYLDFLKSHEFSTLENSRREAIKRFWIEYFNNIGAHPKFFDGGATLLKLQIP
jgi:hypothetical protein